MGGMQGEGWGHVGGESRERRQGREPVGEGVRASAKRGVEGRGGRGVRGGRGGSEGKGGEGSRRQRSERRAEERQVRQRSGEEGRGAG